MKNIRYIFILLLVFCLEAKAQNVMFMSFNETYDNVLNGLSALTTEIDTPIDDKPLTVYYDGFEANYYFNKKNRLYKVVCKKIYNDNQVMHEAVQGALSYFELISASVQFENPKGDTKIYRAKHKNRKYTMEIKKYSSKDYDVVIVGLSTDAAPKKGEKETATPSPIARMSQPDAQ